MVLTFIIWKHDKFQKLIRLMAKSMNLKLFAIKKLFYLSFNIELLFYKTFILPYCGFKTKIEF